MQTPSCKLAPASALLNGVTVVYCVDAAKARRLLGGMVASGQVALDIERRRIPSEVERCALLTAERDSLAGKLKAWRKLKAPADQIAVLVSERKKLDVQIKHAMRAGLDPRRSRIRLCQAYDGGGQVLVMISTAPASASSCARRRERHLSQRQFRDVIFRTCRHCARRSDCTMQACRLTLGDKLTSLADAQRLTST